MQTCFENVTRLSGQAADERIQKKLLYLAYRFAPVVDGFKSVKTYHGKTSDPVTIKYTPANNPQLATASGWRSTFC